MKYKRLLAATLFAATTLTLTLPTFAAESMTELATEAVTESEREPIPDFKTTDLDGNEVDETLFSKADLTIVNVWGTFCGPCINEMPELQAWSEELPDNVQLVGLIGDAIDLLKQAALLYKGSIFPTASTEQWLLAEEARYHMKYLDMMNELLELLNKAENFQELYQFSTTALSIEPTNLNFWYWNIHALQENGSSGMAKRGWETAKSALTPDDYAELERRIQTK